MGLAEGDDRLPVREDPVGVLGLVGDVPSDLSVLVRAHPGGARREAGVSRVAPLFVRGDQEFPLGGIGMQREMEWNGPASGYGHCRAPSRGRRTCRDPVDPSRCGAPLEPYSPPEPLE